MMRIGLVIFPFVPSHGSILQTFAIYTKLKEMGHDVTIINRRTPPPSCKAIIIRSLANLKNRIAGSYQGPVFYTGYSPKAIMKELMPFINSYFGSEVVTVYSREDTKKYVEKNLFDAFVVGSDQVWRPKYVPDIYHYYLDFLPVDYKAKRIAFCPSFGTDDWEYSQEQTEKCRELLSHFDAVAVRENGGVNLCRTFLGQEVDHLLDPTILLPATKYYGVFVHNKRSQLKSGMASIYYLDYDEEKTAIVNKVCNKLNIKPVYVNNRIQDSNAKLRDRVAPSLSKWMTGFAQAEYVVTDSFHATMFALYFNKPFITVINEQRGASRFRSLMEELNLQDRLVSFPEAVTDDLIVGSIDWGSINNNIEKQRTASIEFLTKSLM